MRGKRLRPGSGTRLQAIGVSMVAMAVWLGLSTLATHRTVQLPHARSASTCLPSPAPNPTVSFPVVSPPVSPPVTPPAVSPPIDCSSPSPSGSPSPSPSDTGTPSPGASESPSPSPSVSPGGTPSPSPTVSGGTPTPSPSASPLTPTGYHAVEPFRLADTRNPNSPRVGRLAPGQAITLATTGVDPAVPDGQLAVALNVTVADPQGAGWLTVWQDGKTQPETSTVNFGAHRDTANLAVVEIDGHGRGLVDIETFQATTDVVVDIVGYWSRTGADPALTGQFRVLSPARALDTRSQKGSCFPVGSGAPVNCFSWGPGETRDVQLSGMDGVPATHVTAVAFNLTATGGTADSFVSVFPSGSTMPPTSNVNFPAGQWAANRVIVRLPANGRISIYNKSGNVDLVLDLNGWFTDDTAGGAAGVFVPAPPTRVFDSRTYRGVSRWTENQTQDVSVGAACLGPGKPISAILLNLTAVKTDTRTWLTAFASGGLPDSSDLNTEPAFAWSVANLVIAPVQSDGHLLIHNAVGGTDLVGDVVGCFS